MSDHSSDDGVSEEEEGVEKKNKKKLKAIGHVEIENGSLNSPFPDIVNQDLERFLFLEESKSFNIRETITFKEDVTEEEEDEESEIEQEVISGAKSREDHMKELIGEKGGFLEICEDTNFIDSINDSRKISESVTINIEELSHHKTLEQYIIPRFEFVKFNPKTKLIKYRRLWEVNLVDREFLNLKQSDYSYKSTYTFTMLTWVHLLPHENTVVVRLKNMMKKKPRTLICENRITMWRLYEMIKFSIKENPTWIPSLLSPHQKALKRVILCGELNSQRNRAGNMVVEKKVLKGLQFLVGSQYESLGLYCLTWNLKNGKLPKDRDLLRNCVLEKILRPGAHLYAICLQGLRVKKMGYYEEILNDYFTKEFDFVVVKGCRGKGVGLYIFIDKKYCRRISRIQWTIKSYSKSVSGSDSISIRFALNESPVAFIGVNLPDSPRMKSHVIQEIFSEPGFTVSDHHVFFMGYLGYTISLPPPLAIGYTKGGKSLLDYDEFLIHRNQSGILHGFKEGEILFGPSEPVVFGKGKKGWVFQRRSSTPLAYSSRILVKSFPGIGLKVLAYRAIRTGLSISSSCPVYGVFTLACQRTHVSHFIKPGKPREIKVVEMFVGRNIGADIRNPQIVLDGDWIDPSPIYSSKLNNDKYWITRTPRFPGTCFPTLHPVKYCKEFLSSVYLKISIRDESSKEVKARGVLHIGSVMKSGGWFSIPMIKGSKRVLQLSGAIQVSGGDEHVEKEEEGEDEFSWF